MTLCNTIYEWCIGELNLSSQQLLQKLIKGGKLKFQEFCDLQRDTVFLRLRFKNFKQKHAKWLEIDLEKKGDVAVW